MKKLFLVLIVSVFSLGIAHGQGFLGKTKSQVMSELVKKISRDDIATSKSNGYDYYWFGLPGNSIDHYTYFNENGVCFLEKAVISSLSVTQVETNRRSEDPKFHCYFVVYPWENDAHEFVSGKTSLEVTITKNGMSGGKNYHLWYFKPDHKQTILKFFEKYYNESNYKRHLQN